MTTDEFYGWLLPAISGVKKGSDIWAISLLPDCEYNGSPEEEQFLEENIAASRRGIAIRRAFVIPEAQVGAWLVNRGVVAHYRHRSQNLQARVVFREQLEVDDPELLKAIGDGLIAFGNRVAQKDVVTPDGAIHGLITMDATEMAVLRGAFERLWSRSRDIGEVFEARGAGDVPQ